MNAVDGTAIVNALNQDAIAQSLMLRYGEQTLVSVPQREFSTCTRCLRVFLFLVIVP
jgi:hypothetical protein